MADDSAAASAAPATAARSGSRLVPLLVVAALMGVEGVGVFLLTNMLSGQPQAAPGESGPEGLGAENSLVSAEPEEVELAECRPTNPQSGKPITMHIRVTALVAAADREKVEEMVESRKARIEDCVNTVMRSAHPKHLNEPGLETIRRRLQHELNELFGDDQLIQQVLIPHLLLSGSGV